MADKMITYGVEFKAIDQLSDKLSSFGGGFLNLGDKVQEFAGKIDAAGEGLTRFGERISLDAALMKDGADHLHELSDAISEPAFAMQKSLATTAAMTGLAGGELAKLKEHAVAFSGTHAGATAEEWVSGFTRMRAIFQDTNKAMAAEDSAAMLTRFGVDGAAAANLFGAASTNFGVDAQTAGDQFFKMTTQFNVGKESTQQLAQAVGQLGGTAAETHTSFSELLALAGEASQQFGGGGRGAIRFASMIKDLVDSGKSGVDWQKGIIGGLTQLRENLAAMPSMEKIEALKEMGIGDPGGLIKYLDSLDKVTAAARRGASAAGALGIGFTTATGDAADQLDKMHQNLDNLYDSMASPALPWFSTKFGELTTLIQGATAASDKYSWATKGLVIGLSVAGVGLSGAASALSTFGMATIGIGNAMKALSYVPTILKAVPTILGAMISPMGLVVVGAAALAVAGYEIYEHWSGIKSFFSGLWSGVMSIFTSVGNWTMGWAKTVGEAVLMGIAGPFGLIGVEIYKHWDSIKAACEKIGSGILGYFEGHSPPKVGPLSHLGEHITIAETVAEHIRPSPVIAAIRRTAAAAAIASTTIVAAGAGGAMAAGVPGASGGIIINAPITINAPVGSDTSALEKMVVAAFEKHRYELVKAVERRLAEKSRTDLE